MLMTTYVDAATAATIAKATRAVEAITTICAERFTTPDADLAAALIAARHDLFSPDADPHTSALLWYAVGLQAAITRHRTTAETFTSSRLHVRALLDQRITDLQRPTVVDIDAVFTGLID